MFLVYLKPKHDAKVLTKNGLLNFESKDKKTGRILHVYRNHEFDDMVSTISTLKEKGILNRGSNDILIDVGGYIGMSSTGFLISDMFDRSIAFEPSPNNYGYLQRNITENHLDNRMVAYNIALSDTRGMLELELSNDNYGDHRISSSQNSGQFNEEERERIKIESNTLDGFISDNIDSDDLENIKLIWMDIQGNEIKFFKGASRFILSYSHIPTVMEFWPYAIERSGVSRDECVATIQGLYDKYFIVGGSSESKSTEELKAHFDKCISSKDPSEGLNIVLHN
jgi:FkbM family methyltransferase